MLRSILSVVLGVVTWTVLWLSTNAALAAALPEGTFREDGTTDSVGVLLAIEQRTVGQNTSRHDVRCRLLR